MYYKIAFNYSNIILNPPLTNC